MYESRKTLLERIARQRATIEDMQRRMRAVGSLAYMNSQLRTEVARLSRSGDGAVMRRLADVVRRFRAAVRSGDGYIGGSRQRAIFADIDDDALAALSMLSGNAAGETKKGTR